MNPAEPTHFKFGELGELNGLSGLSELRELKELLEINSPTHFTHLTQLVFSVSGSGRIFGRVCASGLHRPGLAGAH